MRSLPPVVALLLLAGCSSFTITPSSDSADLRTPARALEKRMSKCDASNAYECTLSAACSVGFPAPNQPTSVTYRSIAGFDTVYVSVSPSGDVQSVRRYEQSGPSQMEATIDSCPATE